MTDRTDGMLHKQDYFSNRDENGFLQEGQREQEVRNGFGDTPPPASTSPDPTRDFLGFTRWQMQNMDHAAPERAEKEVPAQQNIQETEMENALWQAWHNSYEAGKNEMPDLDSALTHLSETRERQLAALGHVDTRLKNPDFRIRQMRDELRAIVAASLQAGENPARTIYNLAHGFGYGAGDAGRGASGTGDMAMRFDHLGQAQRGARTLAASSGREAGNPLLLETVAGLSEDEFARWYENNAHAFREMFGG